MQMKTNTEKNWNNMEITELNVNYLQITIQKNRKFIPKQYENLGSIF